MHRPPARVPEPWPPAADSYCRRCPRAVRPPPSVRCCSVAAREQQLVRLLETPACPFAPTRSRAMVWRAQASVHHAGHRQPPPELPDGSHASRSAAQLDRSARGPPARPACQVSTARRPTQPHRPHPGHRTKPSGSLRDQALERPTRSPSRLPSPLRRHADNDVSDSAHRAADTAGQPISEFTKPTGRNQRMPLDPPEAIAVPRHGARARLSLYQPIEYAYRVNAWRLEKVSWPTVIERPCNSRVQETLCQPGLRVKSSPSLWPPCSGCRRRTARICFDGSATDHCRDPRDAAPEARVAIM